MKSVIIGVISGFAFFGACYLIGCFIQNSFKLSDWTISLRAIIGIFGGILSILLAFFVMDNYKPSKP